MKRKFLIVAIAILLLAVGLSGCIEQTGISEKNKFVGTWENEG